MSDYPGNDPPKNGNPKQTGDWEDHDWWNRMEALADSEFHSTRDDWGTELPAKGDVEKSENPHVTGQPKPTLKTSEMVEGYAIGFGCLAVLAVSIFLSAWLFPGLNYQQGTIVAWIFVFVIVACILVPIYKLLGIE